MGKSKIYFTTRAPEAVAVPLCLWPVWMCGACAWVPLKKSCDQISSTKASIGYSYQAATVSTYPSLLHRLSFSPCLSDLKNILREIRLLADESQLEISRVKGPDVRWLSAAVKEKIAAVRKQARTGCGGKKSLAIYCFVFILIRKLKLPY